MSKKRAERNNITEQGTGIDKQNSSKYRGDIKDDVDGVESSVGNVIPNNATNEFTPVETHYKEGEQPAGEGSPHWELEEDTHAHPTIDAESRDGLGGISPMIRCCDKIPSVKDRNIKTEGGYSLGFFPDITSFNTRGIGFDGGMNSAGQTGHDARDTAGFRETDHPRDQARDDANAPVEYRCRYEVQRVGCENKYEYVAPSDCPKVYIWEYAVDQYFGYANTSDGFETADVKIDAFNHNTGLEGADFIADTITEQAYYRRDETISVDMGGDSPVVQRTLFEPKAHPAIASGGTAVTDDMIGSAFHGVAAKGTNGLFTKGAETSRPNQPDVFPKPGFTPTASEQAHLQVPPVGGAASPQVGYYSLRAENLEKGCTYVVGVTYEIVHEADQGGGAAPEGGIPTAVCSYGGELFRFTATDKVNYLYGQEDGKNYHSLNQPAEPTDENGREILPLTYKNVTNASNFIQIPYATANATSGCGGRARNDGYTWQSKEVYLEDDDGNPVEYEKPQFEYRYPAGGVPHDGGFDLSEPLTREHEYIVYISGLYIQKEGVGLGRSEVLPHYSHEDGVVQELQQPIGGDCSSTPNAGEIGGTVTNDVRFDFNTSDPPKKKGDPHP